MWKYPSLAIAGLAAFMTLSADAYSQDADQGEKVFKKCAACHAVGEGAKNKIGPHLNDLFGRVAGTLDGYEYSKAMKNAGDEGLTWSVESTDEFLKKPKSVVKKTKMAFGGLKKDEDRANVIAYLQTFSQAGADAGESPDEEAADQGQSAGQTQTAAVSRPLARDVEVPTHGKFHLGRLALKEEVAAWDIDIRPDGFGLPEGRGTVAEGEPVYADNCAICHGDFGEGIDRWPVLAGGFDTLQEERPEKTVGSYWPYLSTVYDYIRRAMPFGNARSLTDDEVYALTAYLLYLNDLVEDEDFELSNKNFLEVRLPNEENFIPDDRREETHYADKTEPCMTNCKPGPVKLLMRARVLDVTPDAEGEEGSGSIE